jgi:hypothetical protein
MHTYRIHTVAMGSIAQTPFEVRAESEDLARAMAYTPIIGISVHERITRVERID